MRPFSAHKAKKPLHAGVQTVLRYLNSLSVCLSVCLCVIFVFFTDCGSCTRPISTNPASMEPGEYGLTHRTCFVARRLEVVAVAELLWISWCVLGAARFRIFHDFSFSNSNDPWLRDTQSSQRRLGEGAWTAGQSFYRILAPTDPHQM